MVPFDGNGIVSWHQCERVYVHCAKAVPLFQDVASGSIILNASIAASKGVEGSTVYSATKAAIRSFARTVNVISPGPIDTPGFNGLVQSEE